MPGGVFSTAKLHGMTIRESANDGSDFTNPDADYRRLFLGEDGQLHVKDSAGAVTDIGSATTADHNHTTTGGDGGDLDGPRVGDFIEFTEVAAPSTPASGLVRVYAKSDGSMYQKDDAGTETGLAGGVGGGFTHSYAGYNTVGASAETTTGNRIYTKRITLASDGLITSIGAYIDWNSSNVYALHVGVWTEVSSVPAILIGANTTPTQSIIGLHSGGTWPTRWLHLPMGLWCPAGTYWVGMQFWTGVGSGIDLYYDTGGSDRYWTPSGAWLNDGGENTQTDSTRHYSIRASVLS